MKPLHDRVLVEPIKGDAVSKGGIIITESARKKEKGKVLAIGPKVQEVKVGDTVSYFEQEGILLTYENKELLMLREGNNDRRGDIIAVL